MGAGRPTRWPTRDITIRELYGLPEALPDAGGRTSAESQANTLLSHTSFRQLFLRTDEGAYVHGTLVACYLGVSQYIVERRLAEAYGKASRGWRTALAQTQVGMPPAPAIDDLKYLWTFVEGDLTSVLYQEILRADQRRFQLATYPSKPRKKMGIGGVNPLSERVQFILDGRRRIVGALGQGHLSANRLIAVFNDGGRLLALEPVDALSRPWTDVIARGAWESAVLESLLVQAEDIRKALARGRKATELLSPYTVVGGAGSRRVS